MSRLDHIVTTFDTTIGTEHPLIVDVGSRDGDDCAELVQRLDGHGIAIEARPDAAHLIRQRHPHLTVHNVAIHDHNGTTAFAVLESDDANIVGSSGFRYERSYALGVPAHTIQVTTRRLDSLLPPGPIGVLKIDVEGFTLEALTGLGDRLNDVAVAHLETETWHRAKAPWSEPITNRAVAELMHDAGFQLVHLGYEWGPSIEDQTWVRTDAHLEEPLPL